jgi:conjugative transfer signal peptidase TraF
VKHLWKRITIGTAIAGAAAITFGLACYVAGARVNTSKSIPLGLYWVSSAPVDKDAYVLFCPPQVGIFEEAKRRGYIQAGFCPGGYGYLMKRVLGVANDAVSITLDGVHVNGTALALSAPLMADKAGRPLPRFQSDRYVLGNSELLLMSDVSATSFDGRYFGPVSRVQVKTVVVPVITW